MDKVARLPAADKAALFNETGAMRGVTNAIIEKDFWVCWTLKRIFGLQGEGNPGLVFKGGTSLSKAYGAIRRFSEDIDLSFDRKDLGYGGERDPEKAAVASKKKAKKLIDNLVADVENHIATVLLPRLGETIAKELGPSKEAGWSLVIDDQEPQNLLFYYPPSLGDTDYAGLSYLSRRVKLEFGARGDAWPVEHREIQPYAAEEFPDFFESPTCALDVLALRRTFWEKATILHAEHHRPAEAATPRYLSRHYYDLAMLADTEDGKAATVDTDLLTQVANHKSLYFRSAWTQYETARRGTLQLSPHPDRLADLRRDYREMAPMIFDDPAPGFDDIMKRIEQLERSINKPEATQ
jgi:predicted nucleotidyltransferase component of viral defense system